MSILSELVTLSGVTAAGQYSYRGDRFSYKGHLDEEQARMASIMCRATTLSVHMEANILSSFCKDCGLTPARGWVVRGPAYTVCVVANVFCFVDNNNGSINEVLALMRENLADAPDDLV